MLLWAPLVRGGNRVVAVAVLLGLGLAALAVLLAQSTQAWLGRSAVFDADRPPSQPAWWWCLVGLLASSPVWLGVGQLWPIPVSWWSALQGREAYLDAMQAAGVVAAPSLPLSLNPGATWASLWAGLPVALAFWLALRLPRALVDGLMAALLLAGALQVLMAVAQFATGRVSALYFGVLGQGFIGTFANRNHLADFLAMLLPVWFYGWLRLRRHDHDEERGLGRRLAHKPMLLLLGFAFLVVILSTQSRGGILSATAVLLLSALLYGHAFRHQFKPWQRWAMAVLFLVFLALALGSVDVKGILGRVEQGRLQSDAEVRHTMALATWDAARALWPWGSGLGSFESVFPRFQPASTPNYVNHAHNDYVQLLMELGAAAVLLALALLTLVAWQGRALVQAYRNGDRLSSELGLRLFAGLGALALLLHSWVEFNMHIPALALTAAFLMGVFLRPLTSR